MTMVRRRTTGEFRQPETMDELVNSLMETVNDARHIVILTPRSVSPAVLPSTSRNIWLAAETQVLGNSINLSRHPVDEEIRPLRNQTDSYWIDSDPDGISHNLVSQLVYVGSRTR
jgi:hypothetical protein